MDVVTIELPEYAVRYLRRLCAYDREVLRVLGNTEGYSLQLDASYDALNVIECAIPPRFNDDSGR